eukprot:7386907-Prymnesium_polylepis.1
MEMMNLFVMMCSGLAIMQVMVATEFFQRSVYETMNLRRKSWKVAFELMLLLFRKVEDSGGMVELCSACDEVHLNCLMEQAEQ